MEPSAGWSAGWNQVPGSTTARPAVRVAVLNPGLDPLRASTPCPLHRPRPAPPQEFAEARDGRQGATRQPAEGRTWSREGRMAPESRRHADTRLQGYQEGGVVVRAFNFSHMHRSTQRSRPTSLASPPFTRSVFFIFSRIAATPAAGAGCARGARASGTTPYLRFVTQAAGGDEHEAGGDGERRWRRRGRDEREVGPS